ncbi:hypothetical protein GH5_08048 [Leishmania sp. Ghana 2012 LV757]|uniref:hypothetical protein n=1 Tax=Leishmania sp. Ghana 2012 LV757 TaxID=2803181 RepID=UPI001B44C4A9|nr:hypothetical protein GH5_08048 [Leishmania sp. Ghana 2012 LV757]
MNGTLGSSGSGGAEAPPVGSLDALTLQTVNEQQVIIFRQKELVRTLKERIEELEGQQRQATVKTSGAAREANGSKDALSCASEALLRRRVKTLKEENKSLGDRADELRADLNAVSEQLYAQKLHAQKEKDVWRAKASNAEAKGVAVTHLLEAMDKRNRKLFSQLERLRREGEVTAYECAQWRSLATTAVSHLDQANRRYARDQISSIEEDVHRYAVNRRRSLHVAASASVSLDGETAEETRRMWSRSAQLPKVHPTPHTFLPQKQEPMRSLFHVSDPPPLSQAFLSQSQPHMPSYPFPPPTSEHTKMGTPSSPLSPPRSDTIGRVVKSAVPPVLASRRLHAIVNDPLSTLKRMYVAPSPAGVEGQAALTTSPVPEAYPPPSTHLSLFKKDAPCPTPHHPPHDTARQTAVLKQRRADGSGRCRARITSTLLRWNSTVSVSIVRWAPRELTLIGCGTDRRLAAAQLNWR